MIFEKQVNLLALAATALILTQLGCKKSSTLEMGRGSLELSSQNWSNGTDMPTRFTCDGENLSPGLSWSSPPPQTRSFALTFSDHYWLVGSFSHWTLYNLSPEARRIPEALPPQGQLVGGARQGQNDSGRIGYAGPCPTPGSRNRYVFRLYALDSKLNLAPGASQQQLEKAMRGHIIREATLVAPYGRPH